MHFLQEKLMKFIFSNKFTYFLYFVDAKGLRLETPQVHLINTA